MRSPSQVHGATTAANGNGRDAQGRFVQGNPGGPGNPFARRTAALRQALCAAVREEDVRAIVQAMIEKAKAGDVAAAKLVLAYAVGRPVEVVNPDTLDEAEMRQYLQQPALAEGLPTVLGAMAPELCCDVVRAARPSLVQAMAKEMGQAMFTGRVPGTGEQICPPLDAKEWIGQDVPTGDTAPSANGDNGAAEPVNGKGTPGRKDRTRQRVVPQGKVTKRPARVVHGNGARVARQRDGNNPAQARRMQSGKKEPSTDRRGQGADRCRRRRR